MHIWTRILLIALTVMALACTRQQQQVSVSGSIDYLGSAEMYISLPALHYKYSDEIRHPIRPDDNGRFNLTVPVDSGRLAQLFINDRSYPLLLRPGHPLTLQIKRSTFPNGVRVEGYDTPWDKRYAEFRSRERLLLQQISARLPAFRDGDSTNVIPLFEQRYRLAEQYFRDTPFDDLYFKAIGDYLVKRLEFITYNRTEPAFNPKNERQQVLQKARELNFFSFESLYAQRAGIRDFTNAFANTFGVADSLQKKWGQPLMQYDIKRLGYETLDSARTSVLPYIDGRRAKAYARMHLVAERIGEMPLSVATPSYQQFLDDYPDFPKYTAFLKSFYQSIKRVSPGQPVIPFSLPNAQGQMVQMKDFRGQYVLLDFWASWCIPCLEEFSHMKELYNRYPRDQFEIVAISIEEDSLRWRQALQQFDNPWPQLYGGNGFQQATFEAYRGGGIPFYILAGPEGTIIRYNDIRPSFNLPLVLDSLLTQPKSQPSSL